MPNNKLAVFVLILAISAQSFAQSEKQISLSESSCLKQYIEINSDLKKQSRAEGMLLTGAALVSLPIAAVGSIISPVSYIQRQKKKLFNLVSQAYLSEGRALKALLKEVNEKATYQVELSELAKQIIDVDSSGYLCSAKSVCEAPGKNCNHYVDGITNFNYAEMHGEFKRYIIDFYNF